MYPFTKAMCVLWGRLGLWLFGTNWRHVMSWKSWIPSCIPLFICAETVNSKILLEFGPFSNILSILFYQIFCEMEMYEVFCIPFFIWIETVNSKILLWYIEFPFNVDFGYSIFVKKMQEVFWKSFEKNFKAVQSKLLFYHS